MHYQRSSGAGQKLQREKSQGTTGGLVVKTRKEDGNKNWFKKQRKQWKNTPVCKIYVHPT